ncbi:glycine-rich protein DOT1-like [Lycium barbarum]|uniref:glycine-rich protein DOT1-like n=1 Tax=Lycium barbarum TaxID=112863 RepID=UPI00293E0E9C|nr:glycine-rich protein DOT1-like [Lycium barbarum]
MFSDYSDRYFDRIFEKRKNCSVLTRKNEEVPQHINENLFPTMRFSSELLTDGGGSAGASSDDGGNDDGGGGDGGSGSGSGGDGAGASGDDDGNDDGGGGGGGGADTGGDGGGSGDDGDDTGGGGGGCITCLQRIPKLCFGVGGVGVPPSLFLSTLFSFPAELM